MFASALPPLKKPPCVAPGNSEPGLCLSHSNFSLPKVSVMFARPTVGSARNIRVTEGLGVESVSVDHGAILVSVIEHGGPLWLPARHVDSERCPRRTFCVMRKQKAGIFRDSHSHIPTTSFSRQRGSYGDGRMECVRATVAISGSVRWYTKQFVF